MFKKLAAQGQLHDHLARVAAGAEEMELEMERQYLQKNPPPEDYQERLNHLAQAKWVAQEITLHEMILLPDEASANAIRRGHY
jgi:hypothetical protein